MIPRLLAAVGLLWAGIAALDPFRPSGSFFGPLLVLAALALVRWRRQPAGRYVVATALALAYAVSAHVLIEFRADSASYYAYLRSLAFDYDLDFRNEFDHFLEEPPPNVAERTVNVFSIGPAVLWSPFLGLAHLYVLVDRALGSSLHPIDGFSLPYLRSTAVGTVTVVVLGATLLALMLARTSGMAISILSVAGAVFASPVLYYTFFVPAMSHGVTFGVAAALLWAWDRAREKPPLASWILLGALYGLVTLCRWQASVYALLIAPLAIEALRRKTVSMRWVLAGGAASFIAFLPQLIAWKVGFGHWILLPQGSTFLDASSPNWLDTLVSADHGFFNWTPLMALGFLGLFSGLGHSPLLYGGSLLAFGATAWVNGSVPEYDWAGGDAFGARRYSLVVPLMALGLSRALELSAHVLRRRPLVAPAGILVLFALWNLGFLSHFRARKYPEAAPLDRLARDQARSLREWAQELGGFVAGRRGRALAYKLFSAEYFYTGFNRSGTILLRGADETYLLHGWGAPSRRIARITFREAIFPEACVRVPLEKPFPMTVAVSARAPDGLEGQSVTFVMNGHELVSSPLTLDWQELPFLVPEETLVPGENALCLRFEKSLPEEPIAALVEKVQLP